MHNAWFSSMQDAEIKFFAKIVKFAEIIANI